MAELRSRINTEGTKTKVSKKKIEEQKPKIVAVMPARGKSTRIHAETHSEDIHKVMIPVARKQNMIEKTVLDHADFGIDKFAVLKGFLAEMVEEHLGDGSRWVVEMQCLLTAMRIYLI